MISGGLLIVIVGPSGVGKDSIIAGLLDHAGPDFPLLMAPRWCTRLTTGGIGHIPCGEREFRLRQQFGCFALNWEANGHRYAIGQEINWWLASGAMVLINGSRGHAAEALATYKQCRLLMITADPDVVASRLRQRGRENEAAIQARLARSPALPADPRQATVSNNFDLDSAVSSAKQVIQHWADELPASPHHEALPGNRPSNT